tara:strand:- start:42651 stop:44384 length:1734 start_codon:yes stop_codon:yes gene_type:complete
MATAEQLITENLDIWTSVVQTKSAAGRGSSNKLELYGIKKLRELILELAVRGLLVPQDPKEGSALELVDKIAEARSELIKAKGIKEPRRWKEAAEEEKAPLTLPGQWVEMANSQLFFFRKGKKPKNISDVDIGQPYLDIEALDRHNILRFTDDTRCPTCTEEDILVVCDGSRSGLVLQGKNGVIGSTLAVIETPQFVQPYVRLIFQQAFQRLNSTMKGAAIPHLDTKTLLSETIGLPPFQEQARIVAKVDELMALCDQLEQQQEASITAHQTLVQTLLDALTSASERDGFEAAWKRIAEHFDTLFTTEWSIDQLKQCILQLAVMGKLVPQDPNDEPASVLLKKIADEKAKLVKEGKIKKQKPSPPVDEDEEPFDLPSSWEWVRIGEASILTDYGLSDKASPAGEGVPVLAMGHIQSGRVVLGGQKVVPDTVDSLPELYLENRDLLYNRTNSVELVGKTGIYLGNDNEYTFASYLIRIKTIKSALLPEFINFNMLTPKFRTTQIEPHLKQQCGQANVNGTIMKSMLVAVAPEAEIVRIVAKVDELMSICDSIKNRINASQVSQLKLADFITEIRILRE